MSAKSKLELGSVLEPLSYEHTQSGAAADWVIDHGFGLPGEPRVLAYDHDGLFMKPAAVEVVSEDRLVARFGAPASGTAIAFMPNVISLDAVQIRGRLKVGDTHIGGSQGRLHIGGRKLLTEDDTPGGGPPDLGLDTEVTIGGDAAGSGPLRRPIQVELSPSGVAAGQYGSGLLVPVIEVDAKGRDGVPRGDVRPEDGAARRKGVRPQGGQRRPGPQRLQLGHGQHPRHQGAGKPMTPLRISTLVDSPTRRRRRGSTLR